MKFFAEQGSGEQVWAKRGQRLTRKSRHSGSPTLWGYADIIRGNYLLSDRFQALKYQFLVQTRQEVLFRFCWCPDVTEPLESRENLGRLVYTLLCSRSFGISRRVVDESQSMAILLKNSFQSKPLLFAHAPKHKQYFAILRAERPFFISERRFPPYP